MVNLTNRQLGLLRLSNLLTQNTLTDNNTTSNTNTNSGISENISIDLPGFDLDAGLNLDFGRNDGTGTDLPDTPGTIRDVLLTMVNERLQVTTTSGVITGTLISVQGNYIVIIEADGSQVLVPINEIDTFREL
ncbi:DUF2642 domain-containing protein [Lentibacillus salicampi]|uniref:DUF2642 domain-containing protein n=1 Tax=Lentibacillus salicampi TaxID=175306 RepID=A0A4Y9A8Z0_9BACI|nr:DUF2642 domain-containing protein [Lentibacillus salicampi]TFJ91330.1 DUF2642 domain-containing protein [Lentibacillus salicampi]